MLPAIHKSHGFSLMEILVFISILSVALVALIGSVSYSSLMLSDARYRLVATRYSEELAEWLKFQREYEGYASVAAKATSLGATYCYNTDITDTWPSAVACPGFGLDNFFSREVTLTDNTGSIDVNIVTKYQLLNREKAIQIEMVFNDF